MKVISALALRRPIGKQHIFKTLPGLFIPLGLAVWRYIKCDSTNVSTSRDFGDTASALPHSERVSADDIAECSYFEL